MPQWLVLLTCVISEDTTVTAVRVESGSLEQQHAVKMKWGRTGEPARLLQVGPKHCVAQRGAYGPFLL